MSLPDSDEVRTASPPTDRVVAVVELLAGQTEPSSVASIATKLELNRSTTASILLALERAGWAVRLPNRCYALGAGLIGIAEAVRESMPQSNRFAAALDELAQRTGCGATLALVGTAEITYLSVSGGPGIPAGIAVGVRLPLTAPVAASVVAHRDLPAQRAWLATAPTRSKRLYADLLAQLRETGVAVFGLANADPKVFDVLGEMTELLAEHPWRDPLRQRVYELLVSLAGNPYTAKQLTARTDLSVSYLTAPVFNEGYPAYEIQLGPMRPAVGRSERDGYIAATRCAAQQLSTP